MRDGKKKLFIAMQNPQKYADEAAGELLQVLGGENKARKLKRC